MGAGTNEPGVHAKLDVVPSRGKYESGKDVPKFDDHRGPRCYDPAHKQLVYPPDGPIKDGASTSPQTRTTQKDATDSKSKAPTDPSGSASTSSQSSSGLGVVNSPAERDFVSGLLAPTMGMSPTDVPQWSSLLVGPVLRGTQVSY